MLSVTYAGVTYKSHMLTVVMQAVVMLNVVMLNAMAPRITHLKPVMERHYRGHH